MVIDCSVVEICNAVVGMEIFGGFVGDELLWCCGCGGWGEWYGDVYDVGAVVWWRCRCKCAMWYGGRNRELWRVRWWCIDGYILCWCEYGG